MAEYIDREESIDALKNDVMGGLNYERILKSLTTADVQPVKHGKWINTMPDVEYKSFCQVKCSVCESIEPYGNFCRNCGADMRGEI